MYSGDGRTIHLCIDMQRLFTEEGPWPTPWMEKVKPNIVRIAEAAPHLTVFTRFIPPPTPEHVEGTWRAYYERWDEATTARLDPRLLDLVPPLDRLAAQATVIDKKTYSSFGEPGLLAHLRARGADGIIVTGSETDVCVLSTVLDAVDLGLRVIVVEDAVCSSSDEGHEALMMLYQKRYSQQIETATTFDVLSHWP
ncbi:MAG: cysteine hydrolase [Hyphomicrobiales bacterium]|nr:cysteine hydrolase [Hyphomicrobiales bacterium]